MNEEKKIKITFEGKEHLLSQAGYAALWLNCIANEIRRRAIFNRMAAATGETAESIRGLSEALRAAA